MQSKHSQRPVEFTILGVKTGQLEPWKVEDSLVWAKIMSWGLSGNLAKCLDRYELNVLGGLSVERTSQLMPAYNTSRFPIALSPSAVDPQGHPPSNPSNVYGCNYPYGDPSGNPSSGGNPWQHSGEAVSSSYPGGRPKSPEAIDASDGQLPSSRTQKAMQRIFQLMEQEFGARSLESNAEGASSPPAG